MEMMNGIHSVHLQEMAPKANTEVKKKRYRLNVDDNEKIVAYIEEPENFAQLHSSGRKTKLGAGKCMTKVQTFGIMAISLSGKGGFPLATGEEMKKRFERYVDMYKKTKEWLENTSFRLTETDMSQGMTLEDLLKEKCPHFRRMDVIFGSRANIDPPAMCNIGIEEELCFFDSQSESQQRERECQREPSQVECECQQEPSQVEFESEIFLFPNHHTTRFEDEVNEVNCKNPTPSTPHGNRSSGNSPDGNHSSGNSGTTTANGAGNSGIPAAGGDEEMLEMDDQEETIERRGDGSKSKGNLAKSKKPTSVNVWEENLKERTQNMKDRTEHRKAMLDYKLFSLEEKRRFRESKERDRETKEREETKRRKTQLVIEMMKAGKSVEEVEQWTRIIDLL